MGEVAQADRATAHLVLIGGTDAAPRRADLARAAGVFAQPVKIAMEGQDQRDVFGDVEIVRRDGDALGGQLLYLRLQRPGIEQIGRAHVELQSLTRISYARLCLKQKK